MLYSMLPKDSIEGITAKLTLGSHADSRKYTFETKVLSYETTKDEAVNMGRYLCLQDSQVKPFQIAAEKTNTLFNYSIEVKADPKFLAEMNKIACVNGKPPSTPNANSTMVEVTVDDRNNSIEVQ